MSILFTIDGREELEKSISQKHYNFVKERDDFKFLTTGEVIIKHFADGEVAVDYKTSVRGKTVYLLCSPNSPDKIMALNMAIDAAKRAAAKEIIPIIPYFPYARQDKKDDIRGAIGAKVLAEMIENRGATSVITFDLHADQIQGFFNIPVMHMEGKNLFDSYIYRLHMDGGTDVVLCAPDAGAAKRVKQYRDQIRNRYDIDLPIVQIDKTRKEANKVDNMVLIGNVEGKHVIIIDDMVDTGGTLIKAARTLKDEGANYVSAIATHGVLSGPAYERLHSAKEESVLDSFTCSDSLELASKVMVGNKIVERSEFIHQESIGNLVAKAIFANDNHESIEALKNEERPQ